MELAKEQKKEDYKNIIRDINLLIQRTDKYLGDIEDADWIRSLLIRANDVFVNRVVKNAVKVKDNDKERCNFCGSEIPTNRQYEAFICQDCSEKADFDPMEKVNMVDLARKIIEKEVEFRTRDLNCLLV